MPGVVSRLAGAPFVPNEEPVRHQLIAHVRRLASDGVLLYVRVGAADVHRIGLRGGESIAMDVGGRVTVTGVIKASGSTPWLAPGAGSSNASITELLRGAGFEHGDDVPASLRILDVVPARSETGETDTRMLARRAPKASEGSEVARLLIDPSVAERAVVAYNLGTYRGRPNVEVDREAYERFRNGLPEGRDELLDAIYFVGNDFGGAQARFTPHGVRAEAELLVGGILPRVYDLNAALKAASALEVELPDQNLIIELFSQFEGAKHWGVWASKTAHFVRPDSFPILDSRAKKALGVPALSGTPREYGRFCALFRQAMLDNADALTAAKLRDHGESPSDIKVFDKVLYEIGR